MQVSSRVAAATSYPGAKWGMWPLMEPYFSFPHKGFVDLFGGGGAVTALKGVVGFQVFNDIDSHVYNFFRVVRDKYEELADRLAMTPYSREVYEECRTLVGDESDVVLAWKWYVSSRMGISNLSFDRTGWRHQRRRGMAYDEPCRRFEKGKAALFEVSRKFLGIYVEQMDFRECIKHYQDKDTLIYADPPYYRGSGRNVNYHVDFPKDIQSDTEWHTELADLMCANPGYGIVSGPPTHLYEGLFEDRGWKRIDLGAQSSNSGKNDSDECLWLCPRTVKALGLMQQSTLFSFMEG